MRSGTGTAIVASTAVPALLLSLPAATAASDRELPAHPKALVFESVDYRPPLAERHQLASGPAVYLVEDSSLPLVELAAALRVGSYLENEEHSGLAELTAALMRRGGAGDRDADALDERIDELGAELEILSGKRRAGLSLSVPSWELPAALDLAFEILARPRFEEDRLAVLHSNLTESMGRRNQDPLAILQREWAWLLFGDFYGSRLITPRSLARIDRARIAAFHRAHWRPENLILAVSGDVRAEPLLADLERRISAWRQARSDDPGPELVWPPPAPPGGAGPGLYLAFSDSPQAKVLLGHRLDRATPWSPRERATLEVLQEILGGSGAISRLGGRLRTATGLVYRVWANLEPGPQPPGYLRIFLETESERVPRTLALAREEIERLRDRPVHPRELETVRRTLLQRVSKLFDTPEKIAGRHSENDLLGRPADYWTRHLEHLRQITAEEVRDAAREVLKPRELRYLVVGRVPTASQDQPLRERLQAVTGHPATVLPRRDPSTLEPIAGEP